MERQPSDPSPFEGVDLHLFDRVVGVGLVVGRLLGRLTAQFPREPKPYQSDHYREPGASIKATHQHLFDDMPYVDPTHEPIEQEVNWRHPYGK